MGQQGEILSDDPLAGRPILSNDPNAGKPIGEAEKPKPYTGGPHFPADRPFPAIADTTDPGATRERLNRQLPMLGGMAAGAATSSLGLMPVMAGQLVGGAAGSAAEDVAHAQPINGLKALGTGALYAGTSGVFGALGDAKRIGSSIWSRFSGEGSPKVIEKILSSNRGAPTPANVSALEAEAKAAGPVTQPVAGRDMQATPRTSNSWQGTRSGSDTSYGAKMEPGFGTATVSPAQQPAKADWGNQFDAANSLREIVERQPSFRDTVRNWGTVGGVIGGMSGAGAKGAAIGTGIGGAAGALSHPYVGMRAGQALYNTPNILSGAAAQIPPALAAELQRQAIRAMLENDR